MIKRFKKLAIAFGLGIASVLGMLTLATMYAERAVSLAGNQALHSMPDWAIQATFAQTAPQTIAEMSSEVSGFATDIMPAWLVYVVFALIASLGIWLISRAIRGMKAG